MGFLRSLFGYLATSAHTGAVDAITTMMGYVKQLVTDVRTLIAGLTAGTYPFAGAIVKSTSAVLVTGISAKTLFTIVGPAIIEDFALEVSTALPNTANATKITCTNSAVATDLCATVDIATGYATSLGEWFRITGTFANAMALVALGVPYAGAQAGAIRLAPGTNVIAMDTAGNMATGAVKGHIRVKPLSASTTVTAA